MATFELQEGSWMSQSSVAPGVPERSPSVASVIPKATLIVLGALLLGETTINYIDRQVVSVLAPTLRDEFGWSNSQYATILNAFLITYAVAYSFAGCVLDKLGIRRGLTLAMDDSGNDPGDPWIVEMKQMARIRTSGWGDNIR